MVSRAGQSIVYADRIFHCRYFCIFRSFTGKVTSTWKPPYISVRVYCLVLSVAPCQCTRLLFAIDRNHRQDRTVRYYTVQHNSKCRKSSYLTILASQGANSARGCSIGKQCPRWDTWAIRQSAFYRNSAHFDNLKKNDCPFNYLTRNQFSNELSGFKKIFFLSIGSLSESSKLFVRSRYRCPSSFHIGIISVRFIRRRLLFIRAHKFYLLYIISILHLMYTVDLYSPRYLLVPVRIALFYSPYKYSYYNKNLGKLLN